MPNNDLSKYKGLYLKTAKEYLAKIDASFEQSLTNPQQAVEDLYIDIHSLRGQSNTMGYAAAAKLCGPVEEKLRTMKDTGNFAELEILKSPIERIKAAITDIEMGNTS